MYKNKFISYTCLQIYKINHSYFIMLCQFGEKDSYKRKKIKILLQIAITFLCTQYLR